MSTPTSATTTTTIRKDTSDDDLDILPSFDLVEIDETVANLRAERILKSRQAASTYKAKKEEPGWYFDVKPTIKGAPRPEMFGIQQLYLNRFYSEACKRGLQCLKKLKSGAELVELLDLVLRSSLKREEGIDSEIVEVARCYYPMRRAHAGLCYSAALVLSKAPSSLSIPKLEALEAALSALIRKSPPFHSLVVDLLRETGNDFLADFLSKFGYGRWDGITVEEIEAAIDAVGVSQEGKDVLTSVAGKTGEKEEEEEVMRDVRSL